MFLFRVVGLGHLSKRIPLVPDSVVIATLQGPVFSTPRASGLLSGVKVKPFSQFCQGTVEILPQEITEPSLFLTPFQMVQKMDWFRALG